MTTAELVAFDLDDTLAPSKAALRPRMAILLQRLLRVCDVCVISGGSFDQFQKQLLAQLRDSPSALLSRLHLMPTCGTQYYRFNEKWTLEYSEDLDDPVKTNVLQILEREARRLGFWENETWGPTLEDRGSQITYSALGQHAPVHAKILWDPAGAKREILRAAVSPLLDGLEVRVGGSTSIDVTRRGVDKGYGIHRLSVHTDLSLDRMIFLGDRLDEGGNDYPVKALGVRTVPVTGWPETADWVEAFLATA